MGHLGTILNRQHRKCSYFTPDQICPSNFFCVNFVKLYISYLIFDIGMNGTFNGIYIIIGNINQRLSKAKILLKRFIDKNLKLNKLPNQNFI